MDPFDPQRWQTTVDTSRPNGSFQRKSDSGRRKQFVKGPIPWTWLQRAMLLPGKALAIGLMLWLQSGIQGARTFHFCLSRASKEGIPLTTARRAIQALERAGLVSITRKPGRGLAVTLLEPEDKD